MRISKVFVQIRPLFRRFKKKTTAGITHGETQVKLSAEILVIKLQKVSYHTCAE